MDLQRLRLLPLNQLAALKLREAGAADDGASLPVFQLMSWGLANGVRPTHRRTGQELLRVGRRRPIRRPGAF